MARIIDDNKIQRIKDTTIELVVQNGYGGASISTIARKAGVAEGYLYRFYSSKQELVTELLNSKVALLLEKLDSLLNTYSSIKEVMSELITELFRMGTESPEVIRFIYVLMHDYSFQISELQRSNIKGLIEKVISIGVHNGEISPEIRAEEAYGMVIIYPIEFINLRMKGVFGSNNWTMEEQQRVIQFSINALK